MFWREGSAILEKIQRLCPAEPSDASAPIEERPRFLYTTAMRPVTSVVLIAKPRNASVRTAADAVSARLAACGVRGRVVDADVSAHELIEAAHGADAAIVLGGDGTFVGAGRKLAGSGIPLLGVNFGHVGFLTEVGAGEWRQALEHLLAGRLRPCPRLVLAWETLRNGRVLRSGHAVNDVVAGRGAPARILTLDVRVNDRVLGRVRCDGLIVSTPVGSSGYAVSAGGPLVHPDLEALCLTAVSPFLGAFPPCVLRPESTILLTAAEIGSDAFLTVDGQEGVPLAGGDAVRVRAVPGGLIVLTADSDAYYDRLRSRGFVRDGGDAPDRPVPQDVPCVNPQRNFR